MCESVRRPPDALLPVLAVASEGDQQLMGRAFAVLACFVFSKRPPVVTSPCCFTSQRQSHKQISTSVFPLGFRRQEGFPPESREFRLPQACFLAGSSHSPVWNGWAEAGITEHSFLLVVDMKCGGLKAINSNQTNPY